MPVISRPSARSFALPPPAPVPEARNDGTLHGFAESEALSSCRCVRAFPFLGGMQLISGICTYLAPSLNLEKAKVVGFEVCYGFNHLKDAEG